MGLEDAVAGLVERYYYRGAGRSGMRRHKELARDWRHRTLGRRTGLIVWSVWAVVVLAVLFSTSAKWTFTAGILLGTIFASFKLLPDVLLPDHIARWERGAWGEQNTARTLRSLKKDGWLVRHDLATGYGNTNRDHIVAGPAVYLLDSKLLKDEVWIADGRMHVRRVDASHDEYSVAAPTQQMAAAARALKSDLDTAVGFPVAVYPVVVIWGRFDAGEQWDGGVAYIEGNRLADWLMNRPADLRDERKREAVRDWLRSLRSA